jgi:hypothetical protein
MVELVENYLSDQDHAQIWKYCVNVGYNVGEKDSPDTPLAGIVHRMSLDSPICSILSAPLSKHPLLESKSIYRCYINCFIPNENPYWHRDGRGITCLYYPNLRYDDINEGGETQFLIQGNEITGILPRPNRMILFDGMIQHRATSFRTKYRYTIALKYR